MTYFEKLEKLKKEVRYFGSGKIILKFIEELQGMQESGVENEDDYYGSDQTDDEIADEAAFNTLMVLKRIGKQAEKLL